VGLSFIEHRSLLTPVWHLFPSKDENSLLYVVGYPKSGFLPESLSEPVIEAKVLINQEASHFSLLVLDITKTMPDELL
jgi:hypothetical protein